MDVDRDGDDSTVGPSDDRYYYLQDALGSVVGLVDEAGHLVEGYEYDPFGQVSFRSPGSGQDRVQWDSRDDRPVRSLVGNTYLFTGQRWDQEIDSYHHRARQYDPDRGVFISRDPVGIWSDPLNLGNPYAYVGNRPWQFTDPTGLRTYDCPQASCERIELDVDGRSEPVDVLFRGGGGGQREPYALRIGDHCFAPDTVEHIGGIYHTRSPGCYPNRYIEPMFTPGQVLFDVVTAIPTGGAAMLLRSAAREGAEATGRALALDVAEEAAERATRETAERLAGAGTRAGPGGGAKPPGLPDYSGGRTSGVLRAGGDDIPLTSGYQGPSAGLARPVPGMNNRITSHVEAHAAAVMRQGNLGEATLYINRVPCGGPTGCDAMLPRMLPSGARLDVVGPNDFFRTYVGR